jgi:malate dehydrogenase (oxaloacetate-decarboxylating)(NADP+)
MHWTEGTAIFASGSPFSPVTVKNGDGLTTYYPNQGNNVYIFPGLGLGAILAKASRVTDAMVYTSAAALSGCLNSEEIRMGLIYPKIQRVRDASVVVAREVCYLLHHRCPVLGELEVQELPGRPTETAPDIDTQDPVPDHVLIYLQVMKSARREGVSLLPEEQWVEWEEWGDVALTEWIKKQVYDPKF